MSYAQGTTVSQSASFLEIERTLKRYGASAFMYGSSEAEAVVMFDCKGLRLKFRIALPGIREFGKTDTGRERAASAAQKAQDDETRRRWRALLLVIKAKLESVNSGIETFEEAFAAQILLPSGQTVGQWLVPQLAESASAGKMPPLLPTGTR